MDQSIWSYYDSASSSVTTVFQQAGFTLYDVLSHESVIQDLKFGRDEVLRYFSRDEVMSQMVDYIIKAEPRYPTAEQQDDMQQQREEMVANGDQTYKFPYICTELIANSAVLAEKLMDTEPLLVKFLSFLKEAAPPLNPSCTGYFRRVCTALLSYNNTKLVNAIINQGLIPFFVAHLDTYSIMEMIIMIGWDDGLRQNTNPTWIQTSNLLPLLFDAIGDDWSLPPPVQSQLNAGLLTPDEITTYRSDVANHAGRVLIDLMIKCPESCAIQWLLSTEVVDRLINYSLLPGPQYEASAGSATALLILLSQHTLSAHTIEAQFQMRYQLYAQKQLANVLEESRGHMDAFSPPQSPTTDNLKRRVKTDQDDDPTVKRPFSHLIQTQKPPARIRYYLQEVLSPLADFPTPTNEKYSALNSSKSTNEKPIQKLSPEDPSQGEDSTSLGQSDVEDDNLDERHPSFNIPIRYFKVIYQKDFIVNCQQANCPHTHIATNTNPHYHVTRDEYEKLFNLQTQREIYEFVEKYPTRFVVYPYQDPSDENNGEISPTASSPQSPKPPRVQKLINYQLIPCHLVNFDRMRDSTTQSLLLHDELSLIFKLNRLELNGDAPLPQQDPDEYDDTSDEEGVTHGDLLRKYQLLHRRIYNENNAEYYAGLLDQLEPIVVGFLSLCMDQFNHIMDQIARQQRQVQSQFSPWGSQEEPINDPEAEKLLIYGPNGQPLNIPLSCTQAGYILPSRSLISKIVNIVPQMIDIIQPSSFLQRVPTHFHSRLSYTKNGRAMDSTVPVQGLPLLSPITQAQLAALGDGEGDSSNEQESDADGKPITKNTIEPSIMDKVLEVVKNGTDEEKLASMRNFPHHYAQASQGILSVKPSAAFAPKRSQSIPQFSDKSKIIVNTDEECDETCKVDIFADIRMKFVELLSVLLSEPSLGPNTPNNSNTNHLPAGASPNYIYDSKTDSLRYFDQVFHSSHHHPCNDTVSAIDLLIKMHESNTIYVLLTLLFYYPWHTLLHSIIESIFNYIIKISPNVCHRIYLFNDISDEKKAQFPQMAPLFNVLESIYQYNLVYVQRTLAQGLCIDLNLARQMYDVSLYEEEQSLLEFSQNKPRSLSEDSTSSSSTVGQDTNPTPATSINDSAPSMTYVAYTNIKGKIITSAEKPCQYTAHTNYTKEQISSIMRHPYYSRFTRSSLLQNQCSVGCVAFVHRIITNCELILRDPVYLQSAFGTYYSPRAVNAVDYYMKLVNTYCQLPPSYRQYRDLHHKARGWDIDEFSPNNSAHIHMNAIVHDDLGVNGLKLDCHVDDDEDHPHYNHQYQDNHQYSLHNLPPQNHPVDTHGSQLSFNNPVHVVKNGVQSTVGNNIDSSDDETYYEYHDDVGINRVVMGANVDDNVDDDDAAPDPFSQIACNASFSDHSDDEKPKGNKKIKLDPFGDDDVDVQGMNIDDDDDDNDDDDGFVVDGTSWF